MHTKDDIAREWLPRYTGMQNSEFGEYILITNWFYYVETFANRFNVKVHGLDRPMQAATNKDGLSIINFGIGSSNAALVMDLLSAIKPKGVLLLGKCGGLKESTEIGHFILPIAAIRAEGTSAEYAPDEIPALPSFKLHKFVSEKIMEAGMDYRTGVVYTTNRRLWEHDFEFREKLKRLRVIGIDMETATVFVGGLMNEISRGALLLVSDTPMEAAGIKTQASDKSVKEKYTDLHLDIGIKAMTQIGAKGEKIKHFRY